MSRVIGTLLALLVALAAPAGAERAVAATRAGDPHRSTAHAPVILVFGDSLSAGYGVPVGSGWVSLLARKIAQADYDFNVVNASVSGETTAGGLARLPRALDLHRPGILILELGANDGLRGLPVAAARSNLDQMITLAQARGVRVLLLGLRMPPNYGPRYTGAFHQMYLDLASEHHIALVPFLLGKVALHPELIQADGLHPNVRGQPLLLQVVWPQLAPMLSAHVPAG
ncbi:MAG TPA: arylesterase [Steroidobacteraceae bacterium]|jgi:acyl-CoA thioesterase-1|nr:arylesterase [Steroidobacteraceae bacterium]